MVSALNRPLSPAYTDALMLSQLVVLQEGRSYWSVPIVATTAAVAPSIPVGLQVMGVSQTSVTLAWQPPLSTGGSPVTGYQVQLQAVTRAARDVLGDDWLIVYDGPSTATTFSALQPGCSYMARVSASNQAGQSPFSIAVQLATSPDVPAATLVPDAEVDSTVSTCRTTSVEDPVGVEWLEDGIDEHLVGCV